MPIKNFIINKLDTHAYSNVLTGLNHDRLNTITIITEHKNSVEVPSPPNYYIGTPQREAVSRSRGRSHRVYRGHIEQGVILRSVVIWAWLTPVINVPSLM